MAEGKGDAPASLSPSPLCGRRGVERERGRGHPQGWSRRRDTGVEKRWLADRSARDASRLARAGATERIDVGKEKDNAVARGSAASGGRGRDKRRRSKARRRGRERACCESGRKRVGRERGWPIERAQAEEGRREAWKSRECSFLTPVRPCPRRRVPCRAVPCRSTPFPRFPRFPTRETCPGRASRSSRSRSTPDIRLRPRRSPEKTHREAERGPLEGGEARAAAERGGREGAARGWRRCSSTPQHPSHGEDERPGVVTCNRDPAPRQLHDRQTDARTLRSPDTATPLSAADLQ